MKTVAIEEYGQLFTSIIGKGIFLTTTDGIKPDTMTISWGEMGVVWGAPSVTVMVRKSRYTHGNLDKVKAFTLSIPLDESMKKALAYCGSNSAFNVDKFANTDLKIVASQTGTVPVVGSDASYPSSHPAVGGDGSVSAKAPFLYLECIVQYEQDMDVAALADEARIKFYPDEDIHTFYVGKISAAYMEK